MRTSVLIEYEAIGRASEQEIRDTVYGWLGTYGKLVKITAVAQED